MKYETLGDLRLPKIGLGTAQLGGKFFADRSRDGFYLAALRSALELGYTHFDTADFYSFGHSEELLGRAIQEARMGRDQLLITSKVWPTRLTYGQVLRACENSLHRLRMDHIDLYLIHWPNPFVPLRETFRALNQLVKERKIGRIGVSNFSLDQLVAAQRLCESALVADQVPYSLTRRPYARNGVLAYCQQKDILITAYTPIQHGRIRANPALQAVADAHHASVHQIALAWLTNQPRVVAIPMSLNRQHQMENLQAADIELSPAEMAQLNQLA